MDIIEEYVDTRFGKLSVKRGYITLAQLKEALCEQADDDVADRRHRLLGEILLEKGIMTFEQMESVLAEMSEFRKKKGSI